MNSDSARLNHSVIDVDGRILFSTTAKILAGSCHMNSDLDKICVSNRVNTNREIRMETLTFVCPVDCI